MLLSSRTRTGMRAFTLVWFGQVISLTGSSMTAFGLTLWAYQLTGQATALALAAFFNFAPTVLLSPFAGVLVDRWNRKLVMMFSDLGAGLSTVAIFALYATGNLQIWHLFVANAFAGVFQSFQFPAYSASISLMLPKEQYGRAQGMMAMAESGSGILAPILAGALLGIVGLSGILLIDIVTFIFAIGALLLVFIPQPAKTEEGRRGQGSFLREAAYGFQYIVQRPSLLGLQLTFLVMNLTGTLAITLIAPMILARTGNDEMALASVQSAGAIGGLLGGLLLTAWGGPKRRVWGVVGGMALSGLSAGVILGLSRSLVLWSACVFVEGITVTIINGSNQAIWQAKVAPDVQGRVFATRRLIAQISGPVALLLAGPLADRVFEPALREGGAWVPAFGKLVGSGPGAGMALIIMFVGATQILGAVFAILIPAIRNAEELLPDHEARIEAPGPLGLSAEPVAADR